MARSGTGLGQASASAQEERRRNHAPKPSCTPNCTDRGCGNDGCGGSCGACAAAQICQGGVCCAPQPLAATCAGRCGTWLDNCGQPVTCATCPGDRVCLPNGTCAISCASAPCPGACGGCKIETPRTCASVTSSVAAQPRNARARSNARQAWPASSVALPPSVAPRSVLSHQSGQDSEPHHHRLAERRQLRVRQNACHPGAAGYSYPGRIHLPCREVAGHCASSSLRVRECIGPGNFSV